MFLYLSLLIVLFWVNPVRGEEPIWPLDLETRYLTSNFMEYRPGRFHAGLDLKTQTVEGFAARAVESGSIVRLRATPTAYGRAVYLLGDSGRTYVYAHLSRFNDDLRGRVNRARAQSGTYRARLYFKPDELRVEQGEILGLTGQSGTNGPHLHFEVRDKNNRPTEPQAAGFAVGDTIAPVIAHLRAWPVTPEAMIQGQNQEHILKSGTPQGEPLLVQGPVAFSAQIIDRSDIRDHRLEPSLIELRLDGEVVYRCSNESYDFTENALLRLEWVVMPGVRERWLHRRQANQLTGRSGGLWYLGADGNGLDEGRHSLALLASDRAGNRTEWSWDVVVGDAVAEVASGWQADSVRVSIQGDKSQNMSELTPFYDLIHEEGVVGFTRTEFHPEDGDPVMERLVMHDRVVEWKPEWEVAAEGQGLRPLGKPREFAAADWPIDASLPVSFDSLVLEDVWDRQTVGLYRWKNNKWRFSVSWPAQEGGTPVMIKLAETGLYAVMSDESPPVSPLRAETIIVQRGVISEFPGVTLPVWEVVPVAVVDLGSGLATKSIKVTLDGEALIVEPDLPRDRLLIEFPNDMSAGAHKLAFQAADRAGHVKNWELNITAQ